MTPDENLTVWYDHRIVGTLSQNAAGILGFRYEESWLNEGFVVSQQMPLSTQEYSPEQGVAQQFFANLLPEGDARTHIVRDQKIPNTDFDLLKAIGGECAGALSILPENIRPDGKSDYKKIADDELRSMLKRKRMVYTANAKGNRPRLSLAGAQDKCPVLFEDGNYFWPLNAAASTHIIKFEIADYRNILAYEYFLIKLAGEVGLPTVEAYLKNKDGVYFLLVKRYDRIYEGRSAIKRLHQEDFCQALGVGHEKKYQQHGGPSFSDCYRLVQDITTMPAQDAESLLRWQVFNVLAGNSDGHAKNLALLYDESERIMLAPFYDLVCTRAIEYIDANIAMSVGNQFDPGRIKEEDWQLLAKQCDVRYAFLREIIIDMADALQTSLPKVKDEFEQSIAPYPALQRVQQIVIKQCKRTLNQLR